MQCGTTHKCFLERSWKRPLECSYSEKLDFDDSIRSYRPLIIKTSFANWAVCQQSNPLAGKAQSRILCKLRKRRAKQCEKMYFREVGLLTSWLHCSEKRDACQGRRSRSSGIIPYPAVTIFLCSISWASQIILYWYCQLSRPRNKSTINACLCKPRFRENSSSVYLQKRYSRPPKILCKSWIRKNLSDKINTREKIRNLVMHHIWHVHIKVLSVCSLWNW